MSQSIKEQLVMLRDFRTRSKAMKSLSHAGEELEGLIFHELKCTSDEAVRWCLIQLLGHCGSEKSLPLLQNMHVHVGLSNVVQKSVQTIERRLGVSPGPVAAVSREATKLDTRLMSEADFMNMAAEKQSWSMKQRGRMFDIDISLSNQRSQTVYVNFDERDRKGDDLICVFTVCGNPLSKFFKSALRVNGKLHFGALALKKVAYEEKLVLIHSLLRATADVEEIRKAVNEIAKQGDRVEGNLHEADLY